LQGGERGKEKVSTQGHFRGRGLREEKSLGFGKAVRDIECSADPSIVITSIPSEELKKRRRRKEKREIKGNRLT